MAEAEVKQKMNIGSASLILIFIILCLVTLGFLSVSTSMSNRKLAEKNADAVKAFYQADAQGEEFLQTVDRTAAAIWAETADIKDRRARLKEQLKDFYNEQLGVIQKDIPMNFGQILHIELQFDDQGQYQILCWKVYNQDIYDIDDSIPVWLGE